MCGISGAFNPGGLSPDDAGLVARFGRIMRHRGPDDEGLFADAACALGHRRLAIIDLSRDGRQPFASQGGRFQLVFNGEIYNYLELRGELAAKGHVFRTKTDTEVLLAAWLEWGPDCLPRFNGMFAFAVYDTQARALFLARDRCGVKPLYYAVVGGTFYFASEIKALLAVPGLSRAVDAQALFDYLAYNRTDVADETFLAAVRKLPKGCRMAVDAGGTRIARWWDPMAFLDARLDVPLETARRTVEELVVSAMTLRMRSDVPVGSCLSGGLDSSTMVGILFDRLHAPQGYPCFTAAFPGHAVDETAHVDDLRRRYPFESLRTFPTGASCLDNLRDLAWHNDEPTTGAAIYAQYEVMRLARQHGVTVLLDGQGGDEGFAGYQYLHGFNLYGLWRRGNAPGLVRELAKVVVRRQDRSSLTTFGYLVLPRALRKAALRAASPFLSRDFFKAHADKSLITREFFDAGDLNAALARHYQYKLEHLLRTEDRNSMAFSVESRVPFLDYRLVEYLLGLSGSFKIRDGETKYLQKLALAAYATPGIVARKDKIGFTTPMDAWLRAAPWQELARRSYATVRAAYPGVFDAAPSFDKSGHCWKIIQLALFSDLFLSNAEIPR